MGILLLFIAITAFFIPTIAGIYFNKKYKSKKLKDYDVLILIISTIYFIFGVFIFLWGLGILKFSLDKLLILLTLLIAIQTISLISILSKIQKNSKIMYQIPLLLLSIIPVLVDRSYFHVVMPVAFLITIMTFLTFVDEHKRHISLLILYSSISLMFYLSIFVTTKPMLFLTLISTILFVLFFLEFLKTLKSNKHPRYYPKSLQISPIVSFSKHLIFIIIITNFVFVGTITIHELGHVSAAKISNCEHVSIVYEMNGFPHTEINCVDTPMKQNWILGGIILPLVIAALLIFGGGVSIKEIALEIIGFNLAISYLDYQALGLSKLISLIIMIFGISLSVLGLALLAKSRTK